MLETSPNGGYTMKTHGSIRRALGLILVTGLAASAGCVQPRTLEQANDDAAHQGAETDAITPERVSELAKELEGFRRYAARMEEIYAAQETEILALRAEVADLKSEKNGGD
jgi:hypothetical protein